MSEMFKNYPQPEDYIPNNRPRCCRHHPINLMTGETTSHSFDIPFDVKEDTLDYKVIYKLGINIVIEKGKDELELSEYDVERHETTITCELSSEETSLFKFTSLNAYVQIQFTMKDNSTVFTEIYPIKILNSLAVEL